jgi:hypothetical protein
MIGGCHHIWRAARSWLRASIVTGSGSASFEIVRALVERLHVLVLPRYGQHRAEDPSSRSGGAQEPGRREVRLDDEQCEAEDHEAEAEPSHVTAPAAAGRRRCDSLSVTERTAPWELASTLEAP